jgi:hypothetical protein
MKGLPANDRISNDIAIATAPAASPGMNEVVVEMLPFSISNIT